LTKSLEARSLSAVKNIKFTHTVGGFFKIKNRPTKAGFSYLTLSSVRVLITVYVELKAEKGQAEVAAFLLIRCMVKHICCGLMVIFLIAVRANRWTERLGKIYG